MTQKRWFKVKTRSSHYAQRPAQEMTLIGARACARVSLSQACISVPQTVFISVTDELQRIDHPGPHAGVNVCVADK